ncbi:hypothetical protein [Microcystis aeruginosa]|uniref:Uncharacterized protein n=1 Tax=Microcystis aeruginosa NIES-2521 TaxID=2303983 RepID=A0A5A5S7G5_MICAE|nr:hypothetical protein [Microcystis aeruginosa]GCA81307.1 hypothetical protein MiTs_03322 [Microcystis aeruginosa NIES-2521]
MPYLPSSIFASQKMLTVPKITPSLVLALSSLALLPFQSLAFSFGQGENPIFQTSFDNTLDAISNSQWSLSSGVSITNGSMITSSDFARASYTLPSPVNLAQGDVFLYWTAIFPNDARPDQDSYFIGLEYAQNPPVCRLISGIPQIAGYPNPGCTGSYTVVQEDAELKVNMRPRNETNSGDRFNLIYLDPDAHTTDNPRRTKLNQPVLKSTPNQLNNRELSFRLGISKSIDNPNSQTVTLSFWDEAQWKSMTIFDAVTPLSLEIENSEWVDVRRWFENPDPFENPLTFEAINFVLRKPSSSVNSTAITALALTQIPIPNLSPLPVSVPESSYPIAMFSILGLFTMLMKR